MVDSLLRLHYDATDAVGATTAMRAVLGSAEVSTRAGDLTWEQVSLVDDGITVSSIRSSGDGVRLRVRGAAELLVVAVEQGEAALTAGGMRLRLAQQQIGLVPIGADAELRWSAARLQLFAIPAAPLARLLGVPRSTVRLHAPRIDPCSPELGEYFRRTAALLTSSVFGTPEVYARDLVRAATVDALTAVVVEAFQLSDYAEDASDRDDVVIRRAIAEMRGHLTEPISVPEVAQAAGVSIRGLQMAFHRQLGVAPLLHLRQLRLEAARSALVAEAEEGTTIADIARRFGYANSGRFSTHYRSEYGEAPSATLQRVRGAGSTAPSPPGAANEADLVQVEPRFGSGGAPGPNDATGAAVAVDGASSTSRGTPTGAR
ncbi:helix-turn-helix domain-containing protein [uncultured Amnibacterium sp.]|uniref:helix-turn-helix domain-containing protein n=1 Tax=uncultured Amnibacterium sp. TaxID=1631851 RepID=UPI0035CB33F5